MNKYPSHQRITKLRTDEELTQSAAAALIGKSLRTWQAWESGERKMHPAFYVMFLEAIKKRRVMA